MKQKTIFLKFCSFFLASILGLFCAPLLTYAVNVEAPQTDCKSAVLMEVSTGTILYEKNADEALPPASVTKVMTLILVMEAIEEGKIKLSDMVTASAYACSMGGSQIYLKEGEQMSVKDMLKSVVIASANDAAVALAEHIAGSEETFVQMMNEKGKELGLTSTNFENTNGLDDTAINHVTSARDIAIMSRELLKYPKITDYSSIWMDTIRDGAFGLTNTNRLVRFYKGATGLKTGSTAKAGFCITATAERDGMGLICVIMGAETRDIRNAAAVSLLDWGFANYAVYVNQGRQFNSLRVLGGISPNCNVSCSEFRMVLKKNEREHVIVREFLPPTVSAPVQKGTAIGNISYILNGNEIGRSEICVDETVERISFGKIVYRLLCKMIFSWKS